MRKVLLLLLTLILIITQGCTNAKYETAETVIIACSDFQNPNGSKAGKNEILSIITSIESDGINSADALLFCGDYDYETYNDQEKVIDGIANLKSAFSGFVDGQMVLAQGNHDTPAGTNGMSKSGANDPTNDAYGVFVINNDDYMWYNSDEEAIKNTAVSLNNYLTDKINAKFKKPIFILSHLSLHYSMRTVNDGDGMFANYIFDVLNSAAESGLNIIFLYGHNHSNGWDDYLGGSSVFLAKGDKILIAQADRTIYKEETLNFTYMNAGYVGYYSNVNGADDSLTITVFKIDGDGLTICRYSKNGLHLLKSKGVRNSYKNEIGYEVNKNEYTSPQVVN